MPQTAEKIKQIETLIAHGLTVSESVMRALGCTSTEFAGRHKVRQNEVTMCLHGYHQRVYPVIRDAICSELEIPREYLDRLIDGQHAPATAEGAAL